MIHGEGCDIPWSALGSGCSKMKKSVNISNLIQSSSRERVEAQVKRRSERLANSGNPADNVSSVNGTAIQSIGGLKKWY
jgi:hypothetical protein